MEFVVKKEQNRNNFSYMRNPYIKMIEEKLNDELNNYCVECGNENPEYISINNGIFICVECVQNHLKFPKNISTIVKNNKQTLTLDNIQPLLCGGNRSLLDFINKEFPKLSEFPPHILYRTEAMVYYRQNLQYLIKGGIPPVKPSIKNAYNISNFCQKINYNNNLNNTIISYENEYYTIMPDRDLMNTNNYDIFNHSGNNFGRGRNNYSNNINNFYNNKFANTICNVENNYDNYITDKPSQMDFQINNITMLDNLDDSHNNKLVYSPQKIKIHFKQKYKKSKQNKRIEIKHNSMSGLSNLNEIYKKPKLVLSPKVINNYQDCTLTNRTLNNRNSSVDIIKKENYISPKSNLSDRGEIINFKTNNLRNNIYNTIKNKWKFKKLNKNLSQGSYIINTQNYIKKNRFIHKSFSQKVIKTNDCNSSQKNVLICGQTESNFSKPLRKVINNKNNRTISISDYDEFQVIPKKQSFNKPNRKSSFNNNKIIINYMKNNDKSSTEEINNCSEVESLPIKINLKRHGEKKTIERSFLTSDESKKDLQQNENNKIKNIPIKSEKKIKIISDQKENIKNDINIDKKNNIPKRPSVINEKRIKVDILKNKNNVQKKTIEIKVNNNSEKNNFSIRKKYKLKNKNKS